MRSRLAQHRSFTLLLAAVTLLHLLLLLIPVIRPQAPEITTTPTVTIRLSPQPQEEAPPPEPLPEPEPPEPPPLVPAEPVELAELPAPEPEPVAAEPVEKSQISAHRVLSDLRDKQNKDPLASFETADQEDRLDYYVRHQPSVEDAFNEPSLQLPFRDTRIYLVDTYEEGLPGDVQRFFDKVTVPFGFTTKNNTRVQCAWILVIAGCSWGDVSYYYSSKKAPNFFYRSTYSK